MLKQWKLVLISIAHPIAGLSITNRDLNADSASTVGSWGSLIQLPLVPAGAFMDYKTGNVITFASYREASYGGSGNTYTASYTPSTGAVSEKNVMNTHHDMFCPGMSLDSNGRALITGGDDADKSSIYDGASATWTAGPLMKIPRGYPASVILSDGRIFVIGGSWSGGHGGKNGEIYDPVANTFSLLSGCPVAPMLTADSGGSFRSDNHGWLFGWKNGYVFQAGPSKAMNWYGTKGSGSQSGAGTRGSDPDSMNGNAVMYDAVNGKIFTAGGAPSYEDSYATNNVHIITIGTPGSNPSVSTIASMNYKRAFASSVVLPDGKIMVTGGQTYAVPFSDANSIYTPELWDPATQTFKILPAHTKPRNYHSVAVLLKDGTVFTGGGGLCGNCTTNHEDAQIYSPPYLFNSDGSKATRPVITGVTSGSSATLKVTTNIAVTSFSLIRFGSITHTVNTDQRRIALTPTATSGLTNTIQIPSDPGITVPGYWMLFALTKAGVPSTGVGIKIAFGS